MLSSSQPFTWSNSIKAEGEKREGNGGCETLLPVTAERHVALGAKARGGISFIEAEHVTLLCPFI